MLLKVVLSGITGNGGRTSDRKKVGERGFSFPVSSIKVDYWAEVGGGGIIIFTNHLNITVLNSGKNTPPPPPPGLDENKTWDTAYCSVFSTVTMHTTLRYQKS